MNRIEKSSWIEKCIYGLGNVGANLCWTFMGMYITMYYTDSVGIAAATAGEQREGNKGRGDDAEGGLRAEGQRGKTAPVWPCEGLCRANRDREASVARQRELAALVGAV